MTGECTEALRCLDMGDLVNWLGLPYPCNHSDMASVFAGGDEPGNGMLSGQPMQFRMYRTPHQPEPMQAWFDQQGNAVMVTLHQPHISTDTPELLARLGPPEKKLDMDIGYHADAFQWIYAGRGMTLYVREHIPELARVAVYQPSVPMYYETYLGARDQRHYWPNP
jgi:hypothetical protein